jgi:hypothetical protein
MCNPAVIPYVIAAVAAIGAGYAAKQKGEYDDGVAKYNARNLQNDAIKTRNKGTEEENAHREKVRQLISQQRATLGAAGVDLNSGSPLQMQTDAALLGEVDALKIRSNYGEAAKSLDDQSNLTLNMGAEAKRAGNSQFANSIFGAGSVAANWYTKKSSAVDNSQAAPVVTSEATLIK